MKRLLAILVTLTLTWTLSLAESTNAKNFDSYYLQLGIDALNSKFRIQNSTKTDTIVVTEYRDRVIEHPPERYVPKFYKWCTVALWAIVLLAIGRLALKRWL
jgi:hypothetical protein